MPDSAAIRRAQLESDGVDSPCFQLQATQLRRIADYVMLHTPRCLSPTGACQILLSNNLTRVFPIPHAAPSFDASVPGCPGLALALSDSLDVSAASSPDEPVEGTAADKGA